MAAGAALLVTGAVAYVVFHLPQLGPNPGNVWKWVVAFSPALIFFAAYCAKHGTGILQSQLQMERASKWKQFLISIAFFAVFTGAFLAYALRGGSNPLVAIALLAGSLSGYVMMIVSSSSKDENSGYPWAVQIQIGMIVVSAALLTVTILLLSAAEKAKQNRLANPPNVIQKK